MEDYREEYDSRFERPYIGRKTVGFSGIDPAVSPEEISRAIADAVNSERLKFDAGEIT